MRTMTDLFILLFEDKMFAGDFLNIINNNDKRKKSPMAVLNEIAYQTLKVCADRKFYASGH